MLLTWSEMKIYYFIMIYDTFCHFKLVFSSNIVTRSNWEFWISAGAREPSLNSTSKKKTMTAVLAMFKNFSLPTYVLNWHKFSLLCLFCRPTLSNVHHRIRTSEMIHQIATTVQWSLKLHQHESQKPQKRRRKRIPTSHKSECFYCPLTTPTPTTSISWSHLLGKKNRLNRK